MTSHFRFQIAEEIFQRFPDYIVGGLVATGFDNTQSSQQVSELLANAAIRAQATFDGVDLKTAPHFAVWRDAFATAGWSASRYPASVESLHKRIQRGMTIPSINTAVDLANSAVLYYSIPVGTHDIDSIGADKLMVRLATSNDSFVSMSGTSEAPEQNEIVYAVGSDVRTRRWVWRQGQNALVSDTATKIFFPLDGFAGATQHSVEAALNFLAHLCEEHGARVETMLLHKERSAIDVSI